MNSFFFDKCTEYCFTASIDYVDISYSDLQYYLVYIFFNIDFKSDRVFSIRLSLLFSASLSPRHPTNQTLHRFVVIFMLHSPYSIVVQLRGCFNK